MIQDVTDSDLERVRRFLEAHLDSSLLLLSNLALFGPRSGDHPNSGNYRCLIEEGSLVAVFSMTRRGNLLVQAAGRADLAEVILEACEADPVEVTGVIGDWPTADALWRLACSDPRLEPTQTEKDVLFSLALHAGPLAIAPSGGSPFVRELVPADFEHWEPLNTAYLAELHLPLELTPQQRRDEFESSARAHRWWGAFDGDRLVAIAGLNAAYGHVGQVGGVYCRPEERRKGLSAAVMRRLIGDSRTRHRFERLVLFTGDGNIGARRLYESLGFQAGGAFGILLGTRRTHAPPERRHKWPGQSGEIYTYEIHEWPTRLSPGPGNYIFANIETGGTWRPVLIGECADLSELTAHERMLAGRSDPTHVHVRVNFNPVAVRRREAVDLAERWTPEHDPGR
jgi:RimJ/RimL family protein N-acetyltransferase